MTSIRKACMAVVILIIASATGWGTTAVCAQGQSISGRVTDAQDGGPLPGVNVVAVGTTVGTTTDSQGLYDLDVPANVDSLSFSFVGYATQTVAIGGRSEIDVALQPQVQQLGDVVVTALGIERQERSLGYAAQEVDAAELEETGQPDVLSALSGKVSGVTITNTGGAPGGSSRIIIRGLTSLNPNANNQPLFVVDGVPIDNSTIEAGDTPRSLSNRASDIDPNNIESINVLKSGAATALYGTRAANGAVIITTKSGQAGEMQVNISSTAAAERVARYPEFQTVYGQGFGGEATTDSFWPNWGAPIAEVADTLEGWQYYDIWRDAMQTGTLFDNAVSVSGGNEDVTYYGSVSNLQQRGVIPFGDRDRTSVKLSSQIQPFSTLNVSSSVSYTNSGGNHVPADRFMERLMYWAPTKDVTNFEQPSGIQRGYYGNGSSGTNPLYEPGCC